MMKPTPKVKDSGVKLLLQTDLRERGAFGVPTPKDASHVTFINICGLGFI